MQNSFSITVTTVNISHLWQQSYLNSHSLQLCYSTICAKFQRILCILLYLFVFSTRIYFEAQALSHRGVAVALHTKAGNCSSGLC